MIKNEKGATINLMIKIRLSRQGKRNDPVYRIVVTDSRTKLSGKALDVLGLWHPREKNLKLNKKKLEEWVLKGAQMSATIRKLAE